MPRRRGALRADFSAQAASAEAAPGTIEPDRELLALAAELRAAEAAFNAGLAECAMPGRGPADLQQFEQQSLDHIRTLLSRMAAIPAGGFAGVAAKAGRLCESLACGGILESEGALARSLAADLARLMPEAVAPVVRAGLPE